MNELRKDPFVLAWESVKRLPDGTIPWTREEIIQAEKDAVELGLVWNDPTNDAFINVIGVTLALHKAFPQNDTKPL